MKKPKPVTVEQEFDKEGNLILTLPDEFVKYLGWKVGEKLDFQVKDGKIYLRKKVAKKK